MDNGFLTVKEAAQYLGLKESNLYSKVERHEIPHYRVGRLIRFKKEKLDEWVEKGRVDCLDADKEAKKITSANKKPNSSLNTDSAVKKAIVEGKKTGYNLDDGKSDRIKGLRKEVSHGDL